MSSSEDPATSDSSNDSLTPSRSKPFGPVLQLLSDSDETSSSDSSDIIGGASAVKLRRMQTDSDVESIDDGNENYAQGDKCGTNWCIPKGNQAKINFSGSPGIKICQPEILNYTEAQDFYFLFATENIFQIIVDQTNKYAAQVLAKKQSHRLNDWHETNISEIKQFLGLIIWMGIVRLPKINLYWSKDKAFVQTIPSAVMSRNRFELLLRFIHFSNNDETDANNRLSKISEIVEILNNNFQKYYHPDETLCVHDSLMPFDEGLTYGQYLRQKRHSHGTKIVKLCGGVGYTYCFRVYSGKRSDKDNSLRNATSEFVMSLCKNILGKGHTICMDDFYTSIDLAERLIASNTHLVGTLAKNRRGIPRDVKAAKLKRDEIIARENKKGITVMKWKSKKDILMLSTKHSTEMVILKKKSFSYRKPKVVADYNSSKSSVVLSNQMAKYSTPLRITLKWYRRWVLELLLNTCVANAFVLFNHVTRSNVNVTDFRMKLVKHLIQFDDKEMDCSSSSTGLQKKARHEMKKKPGPTRTARQCCKMCYKKNAALLGRMVAKNRTKKVVTYCGDCTDSPFLCLPCFNAVHRNMRM